jgi:hypothetical protein
LFNQEGDFKNSFFLFTGQLTKDIRFNLDSSSNFGVTLVVSREFQFYPYNACFFTTLDISGMNIVL